MTLQPRLEPKYKNITNSFKDDIRDCTKPSDGECAEARIELSRGLNEKVTREAILRVMPSL